MGQWRGRGVNSGIYYLTEKTIQIDLLTLFFNLLARPCSRAVDSVHKYTEYWLNTYNPKIRWVPDTRKYDGRQRQCLPELYFLPARLQKLFPLCWSLLYWIVQECLTTLCASAHYLAHTVSGRGLFLAVQILHYLNILLTLCIFSLICDLFYPI